MLLLLSSCSTLGYYAQSIGGHMDIVSRTESIATLLNEPKLDAKLQQRLRLAMAARRYASDSLALPDNNSYTDYADLKRPYAVWNVIATRPLSTEAKQWCFLFIGCIQYRGYFDKAEAQAYAAKLAADGFDVYVAGARAYSTLGWFDDPLLNTMVYQSDSRLVGVIFHELAHQRVYVKGDTAFNEAFATTVEREGVRRWYRDHDQPEQFEAYLARAAHQRSFHELLLDTRQRLAALYARDIPDAVKRRDKKAIFDGLRQRYTRWKARLNYDGYDNWMSQPLNNAHLALVATYNDLVPHFQALLANLHNDLPTFYAVVESYARQTKTRRHQQLRSYYLQGTSYDSVTALSNAH